MQAALHRPLGAPSVGKPKSRHRRRFSSAKPGTKKPGLSTAGKVCRSLTTEPSFGRVRPAVRNI